MSIICRLVRRGSPVVSVASREFSGFTAGFEKASRLEKQKNLLNSPAAAHNKQAKLARPKSSTAAVGLVRGRLQSLKRPETFKQEDQEEPTNQNPCDQPNPQQEDDIQIDDAFLPPGALSVGGLRRLACSNIFVGVSSKPSHIEHAEFVKSSVRVQDCPKDGLPEFAFVGRSNVGKSSLINTLVRRRRLAKTSKTPGKTQVINHFSIDKSWYLVDLPGYGFAQAPSDIRVNWDHFTRDYFLNRDTLVCVLLLVDASVPPKKADIDYGHWLANNKVPFTLVFTKCDKRRSRNKHAAQNNVFEFLKCLKFDVKKAPPWVMTSCVNRQGTTELLLHLAHLKDHWEKQTNTLLSGKSEV